MNANAREFIPSPSPILSPSLKVESPRIPTFSLDENVKTKPAKKARHREKIKRRNTEELFLNFKIKVSNLYAGFDMEELFRIISFECGSLSVYEFNPYFINSTGLLFGFLSFETKEGFMNSILKQSILFNGKRILLTSSTSNNEHFRIFKSTHLCISFSPSTSAITTTTSISSPSSFAATIPSPSSFTATIPSPSLSSVVIPSPSSFSINESKLINNYLSKLLILPNEVYKKNNIHNSSSSRSSSGTLTKRGEGSEDKDGVMFYLSFDDVEASCRAFDILNDFKIEDNFVIVAFCSDKELSDIKAKDDRERRRKENVTKPPPTSTSVAPNSRREEVQQAEIDTFLSSPEGSSIYSNILNFHHRLQTNSNAVDDLYFSNLSSLHRKILHTLCDKLSLSHFSTGEGEGRVMIISKLSKDFSGKSFTSIPKSPIVSSLAPPPSSSSSSISLTSSALPIYSDKEKKRLSVRVLIAKGPNENGSKGFTLKRHL